MVLLAPVPRGSLEVVITEFFSWRFHLGFPSGTSDERPGLDGACYGISLPGPSRFSSADGTSFLMTIVRSAQSRRVIALYDKSRTPRRSQAPLATVPRRNGNGPMRLLPSLPGESCQTDAMREETLC